MHMKDLQNVFNWYQIYGPYMYIEILIDVQDY